MAFDSRPARAGSRRVTRYLTGPNGCGVVVFSFIRDARAADGQWRMMAREISQHVRTREPFGRVGSPSLSTPCARARHVITRPSIHVFAPVSPSAEFRPPDSSHFARVPWREFDFFAAVFTRTVYAPKRFRKTSEESIGAEWTRVSAAGRFAERFPESSGDRFTSRSNEYAKNEEWMGKEYSTRMRPCNYCGDSIRGVENSGSAANRRRKIENQISMRGHTGRPTPQLRGKKK